MLKSGDIVEVEMEIDSKNDYEYILFEDMKAAGFEPVDLPSGYNGNDLNAYMELHDERVCFFSGPGPRQALGQLPASRRNSRKVQRAPHKSQRHVRAGAEGQQR